MCTAEEKFFTPLSAAEYRLLDILCMLSVNSEVDKKVEEIAMFAQTSEESIRRALRGLERAGLVETIRTKRNLGKLSYNKYKMISPSHKNVDMPIEQPHKIVDDQPHKNVGSTAGTGSSNISSVPETISKLDKTTSYLGGRGPLREKKRKPIIVVNKWQDDDSDLVGFGLFDNEIAESRKPAVNKRKPATRSLREQSSWTAADVASEFAARAYKAVPGVPNLVDTGKVRGALAKMRKEFDSNATIELEVMDLFFEDPWIYRHGKDTPQYIVGKFLKMMSTHFNSALRNLGLPETDDTTPEQMEVEALSEFVYASDGRRFYNSMSGQKALERYEAKLQRG